ncbi:MAG TPA: nuclear transport factor 2 family protein [Burkholderiaceae bacterium]|nr:nuclear transport factor 2 family protein [Burkholderiaceae bacterium]
MDAPVDPLQRLLIQQAVNDLVLRSAACVDSRDAAGLAALFTPDGELQRPSGTPLQGRAAIEQAYAQRPPGRLTRHLVTNLRVEVESPRRARAHSLVLLWSGSSDDAQGPQGRPARGAQQVGEFRDRLILTDEGWRLEQRIASFVLHLPEAAAG